MLFSLIHTEIGPSSQFRLFSFEKDRLIQSLFGYHHLTPSLMEEALRRICTRSIGEAISTSALG